MAVEYTPIEINRQEVDDLVITCSDHRFQEAFQAILEAKCIDRADRITYPGPSMAIADQSLMPAIVKLEDLHSFTTIHVFDHIDCGAFGGLEEYDWNEYAEARAHFRMLRAARGVIHHTLPHITVVEHVVGVHEEITEPPREFSYEIPDPRIPTQKR